MPNKNGSVLIEERRQQWEREKQDHEATNIAGTTLGNVFGISAGGGGGSAAPAGEETSGTEFSEHLNKQKPSEGCSEFKRSRALKEQREVFLLAFALREDALRVIRGQVSKPAPGGCVGDWR